MNRIFISIGNFNIYWYSIFIIIGILLGYIIAKKEINKQKIDNNIFDNMIFYMIIIGIIGARLYYVIFNYYEFNSIIDIFAIYNGGLAIYGGVIASIIFLYFYTKKYKITFFTILDSLAPSLILAQSIGRWGNFFNQEAYGSVVSIDFLNDLHIPKFIIDNMYIAGTYHHPTFFYESVLCFIGFILLLLIKKYKNRKIGDITFSYLIYYGIIRFFIEGLRMDSLYLFNFRISQIVSLIIVIIGIIGLIYNRKKNKKMSL